MDTVIRITALLREAIGRFETSHEHASIRQRGSGYLGATQSKLLTDSPTAEADGVTMHSPSHPRWIVGALRGMSSRRVSSLLPVACASFNCNCTLGNSQRGRSSSYHPVEPKWKTEGDSLNHGSRQSWRDRDSHSRRDDSARDLDDYGRERRRDWDREHDKGQSREYDSHGDHRSRRYPSDRSGRYGDDDDEDSGSDGRRYDEDRGGRDQLGEKDLHPDVFGDNDNLLYPDHSRDPDVSRKPSRERTNSPDRSSSSGASNAPLQVSNVSDGPMQPPGYSQSSRTSGSSQPGRF